MPPDRLAACYLVIGCGSIGRRHAGLLRDLGTRRIIVHDPDTARMSDLAAAVGAEVATTLDEAYDRGVDAVVVCAPTSHHLALASQALARDCHVFVEKPLAASTAGVPEFLEMVAHRKRALMVGYNLRFDPLLEHLRQLIQSGRIGRVVSARLHFGSYLPWRHPWEDYRAGYGARRELGGGVILDAIHELDYAQWVFGLPQQVFCVSGTLGDLAIDVEDIAEIVFSYPNRVVSIHLDFLQRPHERHATIVGTAGQIRLDLVARTLRLYDGDTRQWDDHHDTFSADEVYRAEVQHFIACTGGAEPRLGVREAVRSLVLAEAAKASATAGQPVSLADAPYELLLA
jgi:predicted dehydrogenase